MYEIFKFDSKRYLVCDEKNTVICLSYVSHGDNQGKVDYKKCDRSDLYQYLCIDMPKTNKALTTIVRINNKIPSFELYDQT